MGRLSQTQDLKGIGGAWAGGGDGMGLTNIILPQIPVCPLLSHKLILDCIAYLGSRRKVLPSCCSAEQASGDHRVHEVPRTRGRGQWSLSVFLGDFTDSYRPY